MSTGKTLFIRHRVKADLIDSYEAWLRRIINVAASFDGHLGVHIMRPPEGQNAFEIAVRFAGDEDAARWLESDARKQLLDEIRPALEFDEQTEILSGIDFWFTPPSTARHPRRWKQWLVTTAVIWPLSMLVPALLAPVYSQLPVLAAWGIRHGLTAAIIVALVVYLVMPKVASILSNWLFR